MRRLITLIFADRDKPAVMVVIRRELPRTRSVGPALRPANIGAHEDPPSVCPLSRCPLCFTVIKPGAWLDQLRGTPLRRAHTHRALHVCANGPDKPQQLAAHGRYDLLFCFTFGQELAVAGVQAMLRLPGDLLDLLADVLCEVFLASRQRRSKIGPVSIRPGRL